MSATGSEHAGSERPAFIESDHAETEMPFDKGGVPLYVAIVWVIFLACFVTYMVFYALPDFSAWGGGH